jgi:hypothetical protein
VIANSREQITLAKLSQLADLANAAGLWGGPYNFYGPMYVVESEAEMLRLTQANPDGYAVRRDTRKVHKYNGGTWVQTAIPVYDGSGPPSGSGTPGEIRVGISDGVNVPALYVWRPAGFDGTVLRFAQGWYQADVYGTVGAIKTAIAGRRNRRDTPFFPFVRHDYYHFEAANPTVANFVQWKQQSEFLVIDSSGRRGLRSYPLLANISHITATPTRVDTVVGGNAGGWPQVDENSDEAPPPGDRFSVVYKFRLKHEGSHSGVLTSERFTIFGFGRIGPGSAPTYTITGLDIPHTSEVVNVSTNPNDGVYELRVTINGSWDGSEQNVKITASIPWDTNDATNKYSYLQGTTIRATFTIPGAPSVPSNNTFGTEGFEAFAIGIPDATSSDLALREGPVFQDGWGAVPAFAGNGEAQGFEDGWRTTDTGGFCRSLQVGGIWRGIPYQMMPGVSISAEVALSGDHLRPYFAPFREEQVTSDDETIYVRTGVEGIIPRYPFLKTTDVPNRAEIKFELPSGRKSTFAGGGAIHRVSAHRVKDTLLPLSIGVGYIKTDGTFKRLASLSIQGGQRDSNVIYPGWIVMPQFGITMAYECTEIVNLQALWIGQQNYLDLFTPNNLVGTDTGPFAWIFNDLEARLSSPLP